jgi:ubiquinone/menaquinone biosynthesis C-methylase UbiE
LRSEKAAVQAFYDEAGWRWDEEAGAFADGAVFDDLRPVTREYRRRANGRVREALAAVGNRLLDAASGAIQFDDYARFSEGYRRRICVDFSLRGLRAARARIGDHGLFVKADVTALPFAANVFDAVVSLHTLYHVPAEEQATFLAEIARVLAAGRRAVMVSNWDSSPWDRTLRAPRALARLPGRVWRRVRRGRPAATSAPPADPTLYFHPTRRRWLASAIPAGVDARIGCWRSVGVDFLRHLPEGRVARRVLEALSFIEDLAPHSLGRVGCYPLITLTKRE